MEKIERNDKQKTMQKRNWGSKKTYEPCGGEKEEREGAADSSWIRGEMTECLEVRFCLFLPASLPPLPPPSSTIISSFSFFSDLIHSGIALFFVCIRPSVEALAVKTMEHCWRKKMNNKK